MAKAKKKLGGGPKRKTRTRPVGKRAKATRARIARVRKVKNLTASQVARAGQLAGMPLDGKTLAAIGREYARVSNPGSGAFDRCVREVTAKGGASSPRGVCAAAGRKKYGAKKFAAMAAAGKRKNPARRKTVRNPEGAAAETYEMFHGRAADELIEVDEEIARHEWLSGVGKLEWLKIDAIDGAHSVTLKNFKGAVLAMDEDARQLYIKGGDQAVNLKDFGINVAHESEILGAATEIAYKTQKDHLGAAGGAGAKAVHVHKFGSRAKIDPADPRSKQGSRLPVMIYDVRNKLLSFAGGGYDLPDVGIRG